MLAQRWGLAFGLSRLGLFALVLVDADDHKNLSPNNRLETRVGQSFSADQSSTQIYWVRRSQWDRCKLPRFIP